MIESQLPAFLAQEVTLTAVYIEIPEGVIGFVKELPGANTQAVTLDGARANLQEMVAMVIEANRELAEELLRGQNVVRESLSLSAK